MRRFRFVWMLAAVMFLSMSSFAYANGGPTVNLPQTGQTTCYDAAGAVIACAGTGQDGEKLQGVSWPSPRFTDNGNGTVTDNLTGLIWLKNANCASATRNWTTALSDVTQLNTNGTMNGNNCGDTSNTGSYQTDWRLPNINELDSLVHTGQANTATWLNYDAGTNPTGVFNNVKSDYYWSSSTYAPITTREWVVSIIDGGVGASTVGFTTYVWAVRGEANGTAKIPKTGQTIKYADGDDGDLEKGVAWPGTRFTDNTDGTITDNLTGLIWLKNANCFGTRTWANALSDANTLNSTECGLSDGSVEGDWRLPNVNELKSLVHGEQANTAAWLNNVAQGFSNAQGNYYWSSSTNAALTDNSWTVSVGFGGVDTFGKTESYYVWPVRGGSLYSAASVNPTSKDFGSVNSGSSSAAQTFTITNNGTNNLYITTVSITGADSGQFSKSNDNCANQTIAPAGTCTVKATFSPTSAGVKNASFSIASVPGFDIALTGTGAAVAQRTLTVTKAGTGTGMVTGGVNCTLNWVGNTGTCTVASGTAITLTGTANAGSTFTGWSGGTGSAGGCNGAGACNFNIGANSGVTATFTEDPPPPPPTCTYSINPTSQNFGYQGGSGSITVTKTTNNCEPDSWTATSGASWITINSGSSGSGNGTVAFTAAINTSRTTRSGSITIAGNTFTVTQDKASGKVINVSPSSIDFGTVKSGTRVERQVTITSTGTDALTVTGISITGTNANRFSHSSICGILPTGSSCTVTVIYNANLTLTTVGVGSNKAAENHSASLVINSDDDTRAEIQVPLTATTNEVVNPLISVSPASINMGYVDIEFGNSTSIVIRNTGTGTLVIESMRLFGRDRGDFGISGSCEIIQAGGSCTVLLTTNYTSANSKEASVVIQSNANNTPKVEIPIRGESRMVCGMNIDRSNVTISSSAYNGSINAEPASEQCWWKAYSYTEWIVVERNNQWRQGSGQANYTITANTTGKVRVGHIYIGSRVYTIVQARAGQGGLTTPLKVTVAIEAGIRKIDTTQSNYSIFTDTAGLWSENYINAIYASGYTTGCNQNPMMYCPSNPVTRETGGVFIVRGLEGNPSANYCGSSSPFGDVGSGSWSCGHIKRLYERGITSGCSQSPMMYCPTQDMTRWQVAAMIIRAFYGEDFSYPQTPYFSDVLPTDSGFKYIQKMKALGLTKADVMYYPQRIVTREEMAAFLGRAFLGME